MYKKISLLNKKPNTSKISLLIILFIVILLICSIKFKIYSTYRTLAVYECSDSCYINLNIPSTQSKIIEKDLEIFYNNKKYKVKKVYLEDVINENNNIYLKIKMDTELKLEKNNIIDVKIIYDQQRILTKLKNIMKG